MENEKKPAPTCRYCGAEMEDDSYCWFCPMCHSSSPVVIWEDICNNMTEEEKMQYAYEAAMRKTPSKLMTIDEVIKHVSDASAAPLWIEDYLVPANTGWDKNGAVKHWVRDESILEDYGITWRCWLSEPDEEETERYAFKRKKEKKANE